MDFLAHLGRHLLKVVCSFVVISVVSLIGISPLVGLHYLVAWLWPGHEGDVTALVIIVLLTTCLVIDEWNSFKWNRSSPLGGEKNSLETKNHAD